ANTTANYLKGQGIKKIDILVGTHPHADHIGGMPAVINGFEINKIYMPKVTHTS
ncbi:MAG TPA: competence protein ComE, partial [Clostridiaceae bacterium]|nr:competence protein ComE [Clostridiaceae bacterium]